MELLLINHPLDCPVCDKGGECPLQNQAMSNGRAETRFEDVKRTFPKPINISSQVLLDRERCVLCARCTRFSAQVAGDPFIELLERGALQQVGIYEDQPFESYFSGNTVQICPVGALTGAAYRFRSRPFDLVSSPGVCEHCASGCAHAHRPPPRQGPAPAGRRRPRGQRGVELRQGPLGVPVRHRAGPPHHAAGPRGRRAGADLVGRGAGHRRQGAGRGQGRHRRARRRPAHRRGRLRLRQVRPGRARHQRRRLPGPAALRRGGGLPRRARRRPWPRRHLRRPREGVVGAARRPRARGRVADRVPAAAQGRAARGCKVSAVAPFASRGLEKLSGRLLAGGARHRGRGARRPAHADDAARRPARSSWSASAWLPSPGALSAVVRLVEATGARLAWVPRRAGERGALEAGALPGLLPGGRPLADAAARVDVATAWGSRRAGRDRRPGHQRHPGRRRTPASSGALLVGGVDPHDLPDPAAALAAIDAAPFVVSLELRASAVTERADVVLPVAPAVEKAGTFLDWEGRARPFAEVLRGTPSMPDVRVLHVLAEAMGVDLGLPDAAAARREIDELGLWDGDRRRVSAEPSPEPVRPARGRGGARDLAQLLDAGRLQDGEPFLAGTARSAVGRISRGDSRRARRRRRRPGHRRHRHAGRSRCPSWSPTCPTASSGCRPTRPASRSGSALAAVPGSVVRLTAGTDRRRAGRCAMTTRRRARLARDPGLRQRPVVARPRQGGRRLRVPGRHDAVLDLVRAPRRRADAAPDRPEPGRPAGPAAEPRRRHQARAQGRHHPEGCRQGGLHPGADHLGDAGVPGLRGDPVRARGHHLRPRDRSCSSPTCRSPCSTSSRSPRSASTASCWPAGPAARRTRCSAGCARRPR